MTQPSSVGLATVELVPVEEAAQGEAAKKIEGRSPWVLAWRRLRRDRAAMIALGVIVLIVLMAIFAPVIAAILGHGVYQQFRGTNPAGLSDIGQPLGPNSTFWLGTDDQGRDLFVRIAYGARISLIVGVVATAVTVLGGLVLGLAAGYFGGIVDSLIARFFDWLLAIPFLLLAISLISVVQITPIGPLRPGLPVVIVVLGFFGWATVGRIVRGQVLSIREKEYIEAARALGARPWRIMFVDIVPNLMAQLIVYATLLIPAAIVGEASLSFLGVGILPPTADWGEMISTSQSYYLYGSWWYLVFPSLALLITTLAFNIFGDGVRDALDPRGDLFI
ncbi:MAG: ABC transporter permease [Actinobacteria bacterium]|nr:ABC transporter permease [Actinomycetota bacterium]